MKAWKLKLHLIAEELFQFILVAYLILLLIETIQEGFVSYFFNFHLLLWAIVVNGLIIVMTYDEKLTTSPKNNKLNKVYTSLLIIGGTLVVYSKASVLDGNAIIFALVTGLLIIFLSLLPSKE